MHVQTSIDKDKTIKTSIESTNIEQNRYAFNNIDKSRDTCRQEYEEMSLYTFFLEVKKGKRNEQLKMD